MLGLLLYEFVDFKTAIRLSHLCTTSYYNMNTNDDFMFLCSYYTFPRIFDTIPTFITPCDNNVDIIKTLIYINNMGINNDHNLQQVINKLFFNKNTTSRSISFVYDSNKNGYILKMENDSNSKLLFYINYDTLKRISEMERLLHYDIIDMFINNNKVDPIPIHKLSKVTGLVYYIYNKNMILHEKLSDTTIPFLENIDKSTKLTNILCIAIRNGNIKFLNYILNIISINQTDFEFFLFTLPFVINVRTNLISAIVKVLLSHSTSNKLCNTKFINSFETFLKKTDYLFMSQSLINYDIIAEILLLNNSMPKIMHGIIKIVDLKKLPKKLFLNKNYSIEHTFNTLYLASCEQQTSYNSTNTIFDVYNSKLYIELSKLKTIESIITMYVKCNKSTQFAEFLFRKLQQKYCFYPVPVNSFHLIKIILTIDNYYEYRSKEAIKNNKINDDVMSDNDIINIIKSLKNNCVSYTVNIISYRTSCTCHKKTNKYPKKRICRCCDSNEDNCVQNCQYRYRPHKILYNYIINDDGIIPVLKKVDDEFINKIIKNIMPKNSLRSQHVLYKRIIIEFLSKAIIFNNATNFELDILQNVLVRYPSVTLPEVPYCIFYKAYELYADIHNNKHDIDIMKSGCLNICWISLLYHDIIDKISVLPFKKYGF